MVFPWLIRVLFRPCDQPIVADFGGDAEGHPQALGPDVVELAERLIIG